MIKAGKQLLYKPFVEFTGEGNGGGGDQDREIVILTKYCHNRTTGRELHPLAWCRNGY